MERESDTVKAMIRIYCRKNHGYVEPCRDCSELMEYACRCLERCPFQEGKTTCARCPVHCFKPVMRERIREVMRFSGPRMIYRHPVATIYHLIDDRRKEPVKTARTTSV